MKEQEQTNQKQESPKVQPDKKNLSGTEEPSVLEKAAQTIAGDNKLMAAVLKILLSPLALLAGGGLIIFCFSKMKGQKDEIEKLKIENKKLDDEKKELEEDYNKVKKKYKKLKALNETEIEKSMAGVGFIPHQALPPDLKQKKTYQSAYLD